MTTTIVRDLRNQQQESNRFIPLFCLRRITVIPFRASISTSRSPLPSSENNRCVSCVPNHHRSATNLSSTVIARYLPLPSTTTLPRTSHLLVLLTLLRCLQMLLLLTKLSLHQTVALGCELSQLLLLMLLLLLLCCFVVAVLIMVAIKAIVVIEIAAIAASKHSPRWLRRLLLLFCCCYCCSACGIVGFGVVVVVVGVIVIVNIVDRLCICVPVGASAGTVTAPPSITNASLSPAPFPREIRLNIAYSLLDSFDPSDSWHLQRTRIEKSVYPSLFHSLSHEIICCIVC